MVKLYEDQEAFVGAIRDAFARKRKRVLGVAPTGMGKTICFAYIAAGTAKNNKRVTIICHRSFLLQQVSAALKKFGIAHGILQGGSIGIPHSPVVVASAQTLVRRLKHFPEPHLCVIDESHHVLGAEGAANTWGKIIRHFSNARVLGVTATPVRTDGRGLGEAFDEMIVGSTTAELIALGRLVPYDCYSSAHPVDLSGVKRRAGDYALADLERAVDKPSITGDAVQHYKRLASGKRAVAFCVSIEHAKHIAMQFKENGIKAETVNGKMPLASINWEMGKFARGETMVLTACDLISEGLDVPGIECAILLRPTQSLGLFMQQVGRGLRTNQGKDRLIILDHAGNTKLHGFPDDDREWSLEGGYDPQERDAVPKIRTCVICYAMHRPAPVCPKCGHVYETKSREIEHVEGELVRTVGGEQVSHEEAIEKETKRQFAILVNIGKRRNYKNPEQWAYNVMAAKLATKKAKLPGDGAAAGSVNGLTEEERERLRVMTAMSKEEPVTTGD